MIIYTASVYFYIPFNVNCICFTADNPIYVFDKHLSLSFFLSLFPLFAMGSLFCLRKNPFLVETAIKLNNEVTYVDFFM